MKGCNSLSLRHSLFSRLNNQIWGFLFSWEFTYVRPIIIFASSFRVFFLPNIFLVSLLLCLVIKNKDRSCDPPCSFRPRATSRNENRKAQLMHAKSLKMCSLLNTRQGYALSTDWCFCLDSKPRERQYWEKKKCPWKSPRLSNNAVLLFGAEILSLKPLKMILH